MRECPQCFSDIFDDTAAICPSCGAELRPFAPEPPPSVKAIPSEEPSALDEEIVRFRRQFENKGIPLPEKALQRAREILQSAENEMRRATVLMADLRGYSRFGKEVSPEELSHYAEEFYKVCTDCILRRGGFIVEFIGDAALAVFGAPVAFDCDTESAIYAALDIRNYCEQTEGTQYPMSIRIGVATGPIQSGLIDAPYGKMYHIVGDTVNLSARLQTAAGTNEILVCPTTYEVVKRAFDGEPTPPLKLKNISEHYVAYKILGERERALPRRPFETPYCGREKELEKLIDFFQSPEVPGIKVAHIVGEAGIGKSRLVHEALKRSGNLNRSIWWGGIPANVSILLYPVLKWLREEVGLRLQTSPFDVQQSIRQFLADLFPESDKGADPVLLEYLFGVPEAIEALRDVPPERIQRNLFGLLRQLLLHTADEKNGVILVADDCQWLDTLTARFLRILTEWPEPLNLTLILIYRTGAQPPIPKEPGYLHLHLQPMREKERRALLKNLTSTEELLPEIRKFIMSRASGNPLFLEEMTRLVQHIMINNANLNNEALTNQIIEVIPVSLRELIQSRIDRLDSRTREVLQCASLLGLEFAFSLIELFDIIHDDLTAHLHALRAMRYLGELPEPRDIRYYFTHGLFRDVAYSTLLEEQKQRLHASLARRLEEVFADRLPEYYELLAFHFSHGGETQKAIYYLVKAADRQAGLGVSSNALENYTEAIELLRALPATKPRMALLTRILTRCGRLERTLGNGDQTDEMLAGALECAKSLGNERLALEARLEQAITEVWKGEVKPACKTLEALATEAEKLQYTTAQSVALNSIGVLHLQKGEFEDALGAFQQLASLAEKAGAPQVQADAFNNAGLIYWRWGQLAQALKAYKRALPLRRRVGDHFGLCATLMNIGIIQEQIGEIGAARKSYRNARKLAEKTGYAQGIAALESNLSNLERRVGTVAAALEHAIRAIEFSQRAEDPNLEAIAEENAGMALAARRENAEARIHYQRALELAHAHHNTGREISARMALCELAFAEGNSDRENLLEVNDLLQRIEKENYLDLIPRAYRLKGQILDALDEHNKFTAREYLEMARDLARNAGNFFEELDSLRALITWAKNHNQQKESAQWKADLGKLKKMLSH